METVLTVFGPGRVGTLVRARGSWVVGWGIASTLAMTAMIVRAPAAEAEALSRLSASLSPERLDSMQRAMDWSLWLGVGTAPVLLLLKIAFWAALLWIVSMSVGARAASYRRAFTIVACASVVLGADAALTAVLVRLGASSVSGLPVTALSLAHAVDLSASPLARAIADETGLFAWLYWWAVGDGAVAGLGMPRSRAAVVVGLLWFVRVAIAALAAAVVSIARAGAR